VNEILLYLGGALTIGWGTAHLYPTQKIFRSFGGISRDNQLVLTMEWIAEAFLLIFTGLLVVLMAARFGADNAAAHTVFAVSAAMLLVWAVSAATGGRVDFIMYRLCAPIFTLSAELILIGALDTAGRLERRHERNHASCLLRVVVRPDSHMSLTLSDMGMRTVQALSSLRHRTCRSAPPAHRTDRVVPLQNESLNWAATCALAAERL